MSDADWKTYGEFHQDPQGVVLKIDPVFYGEVFRHDEDDPKFPWRARLNFRWLGNFATMAEGQERVEWEICNRVRLMAPAFRALKMRRS